MSCLSFPSILYYEFRNASLILHIETAQDLFLNVMESNRDEAARAKEIAEKKFSLHDVAGAMKSAMKALRLYPELGGINQFISVLGVYLAAEDMDSDGKMDYYRILQVDASAEDFVIKKQYRKLILLLHPDKNHSVGAAGAFQLISEAWAQLSDTSKRAMYDQKRRELGNTIDSQKTFKATVDESTDNGDSDESTDNGDSDESTDDGDSDETQTSSPAESESVWCSSDQHKFSGMPTTDRLGPGAVPGLVPDRKRIFVNDGHDRHMGVPDAWAQLSDTSKRAMYDQKGRDLGNTIDSQKTFKATVDESTDNGDSDESTDNGGSDETTDDGDSDETQTSSPAESESDWRSGDQHKFSGMPTTNRIGPGAGPVLVPDRKRKFVNDGHDRHISVPDTDFYDFDEIRTEDSFEVNQIWAAYDDDDGMPRFYARIKKIYSMDPFKVEVTWLEAKHNNDPALMRWESAGFYMGCGDFKFGNSNIFEHVNVFSHVMRWERSKGVLKILPRKRDVWALYRDWSCKWNGSTPKKRRHSYEMVEILRDFVPGIGFRVAPLSKVNGFKTLFQRQYQLGGVTGCEVVSMEIKNFMRFSHQVPARRLKGNQAFNIPRGGCWELDSVALSRNFFSS